MSEEGFMPQISTRSFAVRCLTALLAALALALGASASRAHAALPPDFVGVVSDDIAAGDGNYRAPQLAQQQSIGIRLIRQTFDWKQIETAPGVYNWAFYDDYVEALAEHGIEVLPVLFDPPSFRSGAPKKHRQRGTYFPKKFSDLGVFGAAVAQRYGVNGTFWASRPSVPKVPVVAVQVWNEPNLKVYDPNGPSAKKYARLLKASYRPIKAADPSIEVATAGLPDSRLSRPNVYKYIDEMYRAGASSGFDTLAINPYATTTKQLISKLVKVRKIMRRHHDSAAKLWVTELGWSDKGPRAPFRVGAAGQASRVRTAIPALAQNQAKLNLRGFVYYSWRDGRPYAPRFQDFWGLHTGLLRIDGSPKPAYTAFQQALAQLPH
jgi:polysaccharide biosynthesis protein PslG